MFEKFIAISVILFAALASLRAIFVMGQRHSVFSRLNEYCISLIGYFVGGWLAAFMVTTGISLSIASLAISHPSWIVKLIFIIGTIAAVVIFGATAYYFGASIIKDWDVFKQFNSTRKFSKIVHGMSFILGVICAVIWLPRILQNPFIVLIAGAFLAGVLSLGAYVSYTIKKRPIEENI